MFKRVLSVCYYHFRFKICLEGFNITHFESPEINIEVRKNALGLAVQANVVWPQFSLRGITFPELRLLLNRWLIFFHLPISR